MSVHKKNSPIGPAAWPTRQHRYECLVLLYIEDNFTQSAVKELSFAPT